jgi:hypothetical protein
MRFVLLLLAACGSKASDRECTDAVAHAQSISAKAMPTSADRKMAARITEMMDAVTKVMTNACVADKWSPEVLTCLAGAATSDDLMRCQKLLTPEQSANITKSVTRATSALKPQ